MAESGGGPADSYIGSLISLTSKSEIRYEGFLYTVDTEDSNIALQNVRSYGTEGRKKDGPQILASDKVYEFIIFRGTDIKDLQVKMSPPPPIHNDPAIISLQAQPSQPVSASPAYVRPAADLTGNASLTPQTASALSYYHSASSGVASWTPLPPPLDSSGNMPVYWQGFYRPPDENQPLDHHLFTPPAPAGAAGPAPAPSPAPVLPLQMTPATQAPSVPLEQDLPSSRPFKASIFAQSPPSYTPLLQELDRSGGTSRISVVDPTSPMLSAAPTHSGLRTLLPVSSSMSSSSPLNADSCDPIHETISIGVQPSKTFLKQFDEVKGQPHLGVRSVGPSGVSSCIGLTSVAPAQTSRKVGKGPVAYKQVYKQVQGARGPLKSGYRLAVSGLQLPSAQPLLPLPASPIQHKPLIQVQDGVFKSHPISRGRGRGGGMGRAGRGVHSRSKLLEDFDFIAMNEKFKKNEVWDELFKVEKVSEGVAAHGCVDGGVETQKSEKAFDRSLSEISRRSVYVKDDFFDSLSCDALNRSERLKFSEQQKIDTETFGSVHLGHHRGGGHRGRHGGRGGRGQGRGNGYHSSSRSEGRVGPVG